MKEKIILYIKGIILGVAFIIPGVSGGTLAVLLGIYENLIEAVCNFYKSKTDFKKYFMYILPIGLGALTSLLLCARLIKFGLEKAPIITLLIFLGLIVGGIPKLFKTVDKKIELKDFSLMLIGIVVVLLMLIFNKSTESVSLNNINALGYIILFLVGVLSSATMVIPGISGSFTLMLIGYYEPILNLLNELTSLHNLGPNILKLVPLILGIAVGTLLISKIINYLLKHYRTSTYFVIIGFVLASILSVFISVFTYEFNVIHFIIGVVLMCINALLIYKVFEKID